MAEIVLTEEQRAVLAHDRRRPARVLAGPGTGKSATLVALIGEMVKKKPAPRVRLLTFTRAATAELANKLEDHPAAIVERPSTIHSFAISVLLRNGSVGDLPRPLRIADDWERHEIVRPSLARRAGVGVKRLDLLLRELAANWESLLLHEQPEISASERSRFMGAWQEHRAIYGYTLLSELPYALRGALRDHPDLKGVNYDVLLVDEYQDLNACDLEVLKRIADRGCSIISASDDEQSIFSFRKAAPEGILRFFDDYPAGIDFPLSITQRCGRSIVEWANFVILGNPDRDPSRPALTCAAGAPDGEAVLLSFTSDEGEAKGVATLVERLIDREGLHPSDILILLRSDYLGMFSRPIRKELARRSIAVSDPDEVKHMMAEEANRYFLEVVRLMVDRTDSLAWACLIQLTDGIGRAFVDHIYSRARDDRVGFGKALAEAHKDADKRRRAKVLGTGSDGRPIYTKDPDARGGHHSATGSRDAGEFVGYDLHLAVQARDTGWSDGIEHLNLGTNVPPVITLASLVPAGTRPDDAVVPKLIAEKDAGLPIEDLIWDRGYSQLRPETTSHPLNRAGIHQTFPPKDPQRSEKTFSEYAALIEGHLVSIHAPEHLRRLLPMPPMSSTVEEMTEYERVFNELARYRFERLNRPDADGTTRWMCPFHAGRLRTRAVPETMRASRDAPLIDLPDGERCCDGTVSVQAAELPHWQRFLPGTTAWRTSYGRRQVVEGVNGMLKGGFTNIAHKFLRVFGLTKMRILLAATIAGYNLEAIRSFLAKKTSERTVAPPKRTRKKRSKGTWTQILGSPEPSADGPSGSGRAPPPT